MALTHVGKLKRPTNLVRENEFWTPIGTPQQQTALGLPPALAFHGNKDFMVPYFSVQLFATKARELGNSFELVTLEGRGHYLGEGNKKYARYFDEEILERTDTFLRQLGFMP